MKIKESKELIRLAKKAGRSTSKFAAKLVTELVARNVIDNDPDNWGNQLVKCYDGSDTLVFVIAEILQSCGIVDATIDDLAAFDALVLLGDGDCPECGGEMETIDSESKHTFGDGYLTEKEYEVLWETKKCRHCGHIESNAPDME